MTKAVFNAEGIPLGFYSEEIHGENIPADAIEITDEQWLDLLAGCGRCIWKDGEVIDIDPSTIPLTVTDYENAIQSLVDGTARDKQFRDGVTLASYTASTKPNWAAEAQAFVAWRDSVWTYTYDELTKMQSGTRTQPSVEAFLMELPVINWPS